MESCGWMGTESFHSICPTKEMKRPLNHPSTTLPTKKLFDLLQFRADPQNTPQKCSAATCGFVPRKCLSTRRLRSKLQQIEKFFVGLDWARLKWRSHLSDAPPFGYFSTWEELRASPLDEFVASVLPRGRTSAAPGEGAAGLPHRAFLLSWAVRHPTGSQWSRCF